MSTRDFSWGKGGQCVRMKTYQPRRKSGALTYPEPIGPPRPVAGWPYDLYFYLYTFPRWCLAQSRYIPWLRRNLLLPSTGHKISTMKMEQNSSTFKMDITVSSTNTSLRDVMSERNMVLKLSFIQTNSCNFSYNYVSVWYIVVWKGALVGVNKT